MWIFATIHYHRMEVRKGGGGGGGGVGGGVGWLSRLELICFSTKNNQIRLNAEYIYKIIVCLFP